VVGSGFLFDNSAGGSANVPLRRKKVTKKGATSLEEAIFFYAGHSCRCK
jgi:hypothetical protein